MELRHIRYFLAVAEEKNFTRAAEVLAIAQPPLSRQIKDLEEELGCDLFVRKTRGLILTPEGEKFKQYAQRIISLANRSAEDIKEMNKGLQGILYLATVEGKAPELLALWIKEFHETYPHVQYNVWNGNTDDVVSRVQNGLCDMAIITTPYDQENMEGIEIYKEPWVAMIPNNHPLATIEDEEIDLKELLPYELIIPSRQSRLQEIEDWFGPYDEEPKIICRIAHMINAYELTRHNVGISIYPKSAANYVPNNDVCIKILKRPIPNATYVLARAKDDNRSLVAEEFWNYIKEELK